MSAVEVTRSYDYPQPAERLWDVFANPETAASLDERLTFVSSQGQPGEPGSSYELEVAMGPVRLRQHIEVERANRPTLLETRTTIDGRHVAHQSAAIAGTEEGCRVTWTVRTHASRLLAGNARRKAEKELPRWLAAAEDAANRP